MKVTISIEELKRIFGACKNFVSKKDMNPMFELVQLNFSNGVCTAYATDAYKLLEIKTPYIDGDEGTMCIPIIKLPKEQYVEISDEGENITFYFTGHTQTVKKHNGKDEYLSNPGKFLEQDAPTLKIGFDPKKLRDALDSFKDEEFVAMNFIDNMKGCVIQGDNKTAIVLPYRLKD